MKNKLNRKVIITLLVSAALMGIIYNYFYPHGIPYLKSQEEIKWADSSSFSITSKGKKTPEEFFSEIPAEQKQYLSEAKKDVNRSKLQLITLSQTYRLFSSDSVLFIDARDKWDFSEGHIPLAINIPYYNFDKSNKLLKSIPKQKTIVVYCGGDDCESSLSLAKELQKLNYSILYVFAGGWSEWTNAGYEIEKSKL